MQYGGKYGWLWLGRPLPGVQLAFALRNDDVIDSSGILDNITLYNIMRYGTSTTEPTTYACMQASALSIEWHYDGVSIDRFRDIEILPIVLAFFFLSITFSNFFSSSNFPYIFF